MKTFVLLATMLIFGVGQFAFWVGHWPVGLFFMYGTYCGIMCLCGLFWRDRYDRRQATRNNLTPNQKSGPVKEDE
jgi:hypothetical protein